MSKRFQHLRGLFSKKPTLKDGELYVAKDTKQLIVGNSSGEFILAPQTTVQTLKITNLNYTLSSGSWTGSSAPYIYNLTVSGITSTTDGTLFLTQGASAAQAKAAGEAQIRIYSQTTNKLVLYADGTKPTTNIPVTVRLYKMS